MRLSAERALTAILATFTALATVAAPCRNGIYVVGKMAEVAGDPRAWTAFLARAQAAGVADFYVPSTLPAERVREIRAIGGTAHAFLARRACSADKNTKCFDLNDAARRDTLIGEAKQKCERFDGIHFNIEPIDVNNVAAFQKLTAEVRKVCPAPKKLSLASYMLALPASAELLKPGAGAKIYAWPREFFASVVQNLDHVMVMNYDVGAKDRVSYVKWSAQQTEALQSFAAGLGRPDFRVQLGIPSYTAGRAGLHDPKIESPAAATEGYKRVLRGCTESLSVATYAETPTEIAGTWDLLRNEWGPAEESGNADPRHGAKK